MGYNFITKNADIDEKSIRSDNPEKMILLIALAKAEAIKKELPTQDALLITADTVVIYDKEVREKPQTKEQARYFLKSYSQKCAQVLTGVVVTNLNSGKQKSGTDSADVCFKFLPEDFIEKYIKTKKAFVGAGGFNIEDSELKQYIEIKDKMDCVMGLPKKLTKTLIHKVAYKG